MDFKNELIDRIKIENEEILSVYDYDKQTVAITQKRIFKSIIQKNNIIMEYYPYNKIHYLTFNLLENIITIHNVNLSNFEISFSNSDDLLNATSIISKFLKLD
jgi:hypothetical protein